MDFKSTILKFKGNGVLEYFNSVFDVFLVLLSLSNGVFDVYPYFERSL
jgi:hypothetical protein